LNKNILHTVFTLLFFFCLINISYTQNNKLSSPGNPKIGGHEFITNSFLKNPFVNTKLGSSLGFASSLSSEIPLLKLDSSINKVKVKADITFVNGSFNFQYAVKEWAAIWLNFSGIARLGTNTPSILITGVTANTTFETGMLFKIKEFKKSLLSTSFSISNSSSTNLNLYSFLKNLYNNPSNIDSVKILNNFTPLSGALDLRFAYSPSKPWSILSYISGGYGENLEVNEITNNFSYVLGATVNYNLNDKCKVPIGIGTGFKISSASPTLQYTKIATQYFMFQIAYTGKDDFLLSFESDFLRIPTFINGIAINTTSFSLNWAYFF
jgi:hypothetical protein